MTSSAEMAKVVIECLRAPDQIFGSSDGPSDHMKAGLTANFELRYRCRVWPRIHKCFYN
jgi:hypothetical protein